MSAWASIVIALVVLPAVLWWLGALILGSDRPPRIIRELWVTDVYIDNMDTERAVTVCLVAAAWPFRVYHL